MPRPDDARTGEGGWPVRDAAAPEEDGTPARALPRDPVLFAEALGVRLEPWQESMLRELAQRRERGELVVLCGRPHAGRVALAGLAAAARGAKLGHVVEAVQDLVAKPRDALYDVVPDVIARPLTIAVAPRTLAERLRGDGRKPRRKKRRGRR